MWVKYFKRYFDFFLALVLLIILSPVFLIVYLSVTIFLGQPALFKQVRPGLHEKLFCIYKFRSMNDQRDSAGELLPDEQRLTRLGKFLRASSLDELPQLFNVVCGDMSFVGPRPLLIDYLLLYNQQQRKRHYAKPGITGWAQVNGRNALSWEEKFNYDCWYVDHQSVRIDFKILWLTFLKVLKREAINHSTHVTMEKFKGGEVIDKKKALLALDEVLELDPGTLQGPEFLVNLANWDSIAMIGLIAMADENFDKLFTANQIAAANTVDDLVNLLIG